MNWAKILMGGVVAGVVGTLVDFVIHGVVLAETYMQYSVFTQEQANPVYFLVISIMVGIMAAILFSKTRNSWGDGVGGGATFGLFVGLFVFFMPFYNSLVLEGFPYFLSWAWGFANLVGSLVFGIVLSFFIKSGT